MKTAPCSSAIAILSLLFFSGSASALTPLTENFNAAKLNTKRWSLTNGGKGVFAQSKGALNFTVPAKLTGDDYAILTLKNNQPGYNESWEVIADVVNKTGLGSKAGVGIQIYNADDSKDQISLEFYSAGGSGSFVAIGFADDQDDPRKDIQAGVDSVSGSMRLSFDKKTKWFTFWYDATGSADGYQWKELATYSTTGRGGLRGGNWKMNPAGGRFAIHLVGFSEGRAVAKGKAKLDNFSLKARP